MPQEREGGRCNAETMSDEKPMTVKERMAALARASSGSSSGGVWGGLGARGHNVFYSMPVCLNLVRLSWSRVCSGWNQSCGTRFYMRQAKKWSSISRTFGKVRCTLVLLE